jgi:hypothetical protein
VPDHHHHQQQQQQGKQQQQRQPGRLGGTCAQATSGRTPDKKVAAVAVPPGVQSHPLLQGLLPGASLCVAQLHQHLAHNNQTSCCCSGSTCAAADPSAKFVPPPNQADVLCSSSITIWPIQHANNQLRCSYLCCSRALSQVCSQHQEQAGDERSTQHAERVTQHMQPPCSAPSAHQQASRKHCGTTSTCALFTHATLAAGTDCITPAAAANHH